jgi:hypothetical protein
MANSNNCNLDNIYSYHAPVGNQQELYDKLRGRAKEFAALIIEPTPNSREQSLALTNLEQAVFWANASIARSGSAE